MVIETLKRAGRVLHAVAREHAKSLRSPRWAGVRRKHLRANPRCAACTSTRILQVHHIVPFSDRPELELEPTNLITLCMSKNECHLRIGHGDSYRCFNPSVIAHCAAAMLDIKKLKSIWVEAFKIRKDKP
jgi:5-methylcytosine-specific restriction enzyme A